MSSKKSVKVSFVTPGMEKIRKIVKDFIFLPHEYFLNFLKRNKEKSLWDFSNTQNAII